MGLELVLDTPTREMERRADARAEAELRAELERETLLALVASARLDFPEQGVKRLTSTIKAANPSLRGSFGARDVRAAVAALDAEPAPAPPPLPPPPEPLFLEPEPQPERILSPPVGVSYEVPAMLAIATAESFDPSDFCELRRASLAYEPEPAAGGGAVSKDGSFSSNGSSSGAGSFSHSPVAPFNPAGLEASGCDWVTYASPHFDSRHELVQSMNRESLQDQARLSLHLDVPKRLVSGGSSGAAEQSQYAKAPGSAPANMSTEEGGVGGGDPAFGGGGVTIFGTAAPSKTASSSSRKLSMPGRGGSWSRVTVESARAPRTRVNPRCLSIGCAKTYTEYQLRLEVRDPEQRGASSAAPELQPMPFAKYVIATRYRQVRAIHEKLSKVVPGLPPLPPKRRTSTARMSETTVDERQAAFQTFFTHALMRCVSTHALRSLIPI